MIALALCTMLRGPWGTGLLRRVDSAVFNKHVTSNSDLRKNKPSACVIPGHFLLMEIINLIGQYATQCHRMRISCICHSIDAHSTAVSLFWCIPGYACATFSAMARWWAGSIPRRTTQST